MGTGAFVIGDPGEGGGEEEEEEEERGRGKLNPSTLRCGLVVEFSIRPA